MATTTIDQIEAIAAEFHAREARRHTPYAVARRAIYTLVSALADLTDSESDEILQALREELTASRRRQLEERDAASMARQGLKLLGCPHTPGCGSNVQCANRP